MNLEQLGLLGIFIAGAIPWFEAIAVIPAGIIAGLDPIFVFIAAVAGNAITIFVFAYLGHIIRERVIKRRRAQGKEGGEGRFVKAQQAFDRYGIWGLAVLGPILIGTQFAAAAAVAAGVKPSRASLIITAGMVVWAAGIAVVLAIVGADQWVTQIQ